MKLGAKSTRQRFCSIQNYGVILDIQQGKQFMKLKSIILTFVLSFSFHANAQIWSTDSECQNANLKKIEQSLADGFADLVFPELRTAFSRNGVTLERQQISVDLRLRKISYYEVGALPVITVDVKNSNPVLFVLGKDLDDIRYVRPTELEGTLTLFSIGRGLIHYFVAHNSVGEVTKVGCRYFYAPNLENQFLTIRNMQTGIFIGMVIPDAIHAWEN
jgi:hypothetical protein